ncbi:amino acid ABC transporter permease [Streptomyces guryensis]|uniref:Amino acid ABC transporter permease n=1 Tax=Streptomyces guryensis TaxID=2886947 RepID=A0A9Q3VW08_9ACTN|nr:amino acid ABC transporter permease [Streptomyces guryensis]MCD9878005.1 amino acid ABC transporter permease [Streptomyces guryensis]
MTDTVDKAQAASVPPEQIKAIPVRHYGRWVAGAVVVALVALIGVAFSNAKINYSIIPDYVFDSGIVNGAWTTLYISVLAMVLGVVLGIVLAVMRLSSNPVTSTVSWFYIWFFRGTPVLVQLLLWYNISLVFPILNLGFYKNEMTQVMTPVLTALLGLGLNEAAYMSEIVRAGIQSVDEGQTEASHALGMTQGQTLRRVILPQAMRVIVPPTGNEFINMLKTSSLAYAVQLPELIKKATDISSTSLAVVEMYFVACIWYLLLTTVFSIVQYYVERRYARGTTRNLPATPLQKIRTNLTKMNMLSLSSWRR